MPFVGTVRCEISVTGLPPWSAGASRHRAIYEPCSVARCSCRDHGGHGVAEQHEVHRFGGFVSSQLFRKVVSWVDESAKLVLVKGERLLLLASSTVRAIKSLA